MSDAVSAAGTGSMGAVALLEALERVPPHLRRDAGGLPSLEEARPQGVDDHRWMIVRWAVVVALGTLAFHQSLWTVLAQGRLGDPVGLLLLAPVWLGVLGLGRSLRLAGALPIDDRQTDWISAILLSVVLVLVVGLLAPRLGPNAQLWRVDLFALGLFVLIAQVLLFGLRSIGRYLPMWIFAACTWPLLIRATGVAFGGSVAAYASVGVLYGAVAVAMSVGGTARRWGSAAVATVVLGAALVAATVVLPPLAQLLLPGGIAPIVVVVAIHRGVLGDSPFLHGRRHSAKVVADPRSSFAYLTLGAVALAVVSPGVPASFSLRGLAVARPAFVPTPPPLSGWTASKPLSFTTMATYYGSQASWIRATYRQVLTGSVVVVDATTTNSPGLLQAYPATINYTYVTPIRAYGTVPLGGAVVGRLNGTDVAQIDQATHQIFMEMDFVWRLLPRTGRRFQRLTLFTPVGPPSAQSIPLPTSPITSANVRQTVSQITRGVADNTSLPPDPAAVRRLRTVATALVTLLDTGSRDG